MNKSSRRTRDMGNAVVRKGTMLVAAVCVVGTGAFTAIQAKAYAATHPSGSPKVTISDSAKSHESHESNDDESKSFSQPAAAPTDAGSSPAPVVSGGS